MCRESRYPEIPVPVPVPGLVFGTSFPFSEPPAPNSSLVQYVPTYGFPAPDPVLVSSPRSIFSPSSRGIQDKTRHRLWAFVATNVIRRRSVHIAHSPQFPPPTNVHGDMNSLGLRRLSPIHDHDQESEAGAEVQDIPFYRPPRFSSRKDGHEKSKNLDGSHPIPHTHDLEALIASPPRSPLRIPFEYK